MTRRFPAFQLPEGHHALWQPDGGFVASEKAIYAHVGLAQSHGAEIRTNEPLLDWTPTAQGGVIVRTERGTYSAGRLVITSGGWIADAVPALSQRVRTVKQAIGWFTTRRPELFPGRTPSRSSSSASRKAISTASRSMSTPASSSAGRISAASRWTRASRTARRAPHQVALIRECLARYIPDAAGEPLTLKGCVYSVSPDEDFIIDTVPGVPQAVFALGLLEATASNSRAPSARSSPTSPSRASRPSTSRPSRFPVSTREPFCRIIRVGQRSRKPPRHRLHAGGDVLFVVNDTLMKLAARPIRAGQAIALRTVLAVFVGLAIVFAAREETASPWRSAPACCCAARWSPAAP